MQPTESLTERLPPAGSPDQQGGYVPHPEIAQTVGLASQQAFAAMLPAESPRPMGPGLNREYDARLAPFLVRQAYATGSPTSPTLPLVAGVFTLPDSLAYVDFYEVGTAQNVA